MKSVLLDESVPIGLTRNLSGKGGLRATHAGEIGLQGAADRDLIEAAIIGGYEVFVSCDQSLPAQQNLAGLSIGVVIVGTNNWPTIQANVGDIVAAIATVAAGQAMIVLRDAHRTRYGRRPRR